MTCLAHIRFSLRHQSISVEIDGTCVFQKHPYPLAEFARQIAEWLARTSDHAASSFIFYPAAEPGLLGSFRIEARPKGWQFTSTEELSRHARMLSFDEIKEMAMRFLEEFARASD